MDGRVLVGGGPRVKRRAPRPLSAALERAVGPVRPATTLARVQAAWADVAGARMAVEARPVAEREGVVTVSCSSAVWAQELELLCPELLARLSAHGELAGGGRIERLRFVVGSDANA
jgi:predicted nucleic acid-binding Zn ribbon protein